MGEYRTLRTISRRMNWLSPATAYRRHKFDSFPLWPDFTRRGLVWRTNDSLIEMWEAKKVKLSQGLRLKKPYKHKNPHRRYFWRIRRELVKEKETHIETGDAALSRGRKAALREGVDNLCPICGGTEPHGTEKCCRMIDGEKPPHETGITTVQVRSRSLPSRIASKHFAQRKKARS